MRTAGDIVTPAGKATVECFVQEIDAQRTGDVTRCAAGVVPADHAKRERLERLWSMLGSPMAAEQLAARTSSDSVEGRPAYQEWQGRQEPPESDRTHRWLLVAAIVASIVIAAGSYSFHLRGVRMPWEAQSTPAQAFSTSAAQIRQVTLVDGSVITLGAKTQILVRYSAQRREVELQRGEALFSAARNASRPFVVLAGAGSITAIGTEFDVTRDEDFGHRRVRVVVKEGAVEVGPPPSNPAQPGATADQPEHNKWIPARISKGYGFSYDGSGPQGGVVPADAEAASAWLEGRLEYRHMPLRYVFADVSRYSDKRFVVADDAAGDVPFTGIIWLDQVPAFLDVLQSVYPVEIIQSADAVAIRSRRAATKN